MKITTLVTVGVGTCALAAVASGAPIAAATTAVGGLIMSAITNNYTFPATNLSQHALAPNQRGKRDVSSFLKMLQREINKPNHRNNYEQYLKEKEAAVHEIQQEFNLLMKKLDDDLTNTKYFEQELKSQLESSHHHNQHKKTTTSPPIYNDDGACFDENNEPISCSVFDEYEYEYVDDDELKRK